MKNKEKFSSDEPTSKQGSGVPNIVEQGASVPDFDGQSEVNVRGGKANGQIKTVTSEGEKTKTRQAAEVVLGASNSAGSAGSLQRCVTFGGGADNLIGKDVSATTKADNVYKSGSRVGKRTDPFTRKIDFNYPELVKTEVKQSIPLCETNEKQGYGDNYYDEHAIVQKVSGGAPGDPLFNRSFDMCGLDMGYFADGQYNREKGVDYKEYQAQTWNSSTQSYDPEISITRSSYLPKDLTVTFNSAGCVGMSWSEDNIGNKDLDDATIRLCGDAALRTLNQRELDRLTMVDKAGNQNEVGYCPLGDGVVSASAVNHLLADLDCLAGDNIAMSERKLALALAYQSNKSAKDGIRLKGPMAEMLNGNIEGPYSSAINSISEEHGETYALHTAAAFAAGSAGLWLAVNDSLPKYTSKGKLLTYPNSFKNALNIAKANDGDFRMHSSLMEDLKHCELFSTINRAYDPFMPIVVTDKANVINPISLHDTAAVTITSSTTLSQNLFPKIMTYHYETWSTKWNIDVRNFFAQGIFMYFKANAFKYMDKLPAADGVTGLQTLTIPIQSSTTSLSLWDLIVCSAIPYMVKARQDSLTDVIKYEKNHGYPYSGAVKISEVDVNAALNYTFVDVDSPIQTRIANPVDSIKVLFPEVFWVVGCKAYDHHGHGSNKGFMATDTVLPHYFNQAQFKVASSSDGLLRYSDRPATMSYPSTRSGQELTDMDIIYGMTEENYRLALDRMVTYPGYSRAKDIATVTTDTYPTLFKYNYADSKFTIEPAKTYKYGMTGDGIPTIPYLAASENAADKDKCLTILDVIKTPRELGLHFVMPAGVLTPIRGTQTSGGETTHYADFRDTSSGYLAVSGPGFTAYLYKVYGKNMDNSILGAGNYEVARNSSYMNDYVVYQAIPGNATADFGMVFSISNGIEATATAHEFKLGSGSFDFVPFVTGSYAGTAYDPSTGVYGANETKATSTSGQLDVISFQKYNWARAQRMPFVINPFDANASDLSYSESGTNHGNKYDPYDYLYTYGFCGFRASDYMELTYDRNRARIAYGMNYVNDPYIDKTMLLK